MNKPPQELQVVARDKKESAAVLAKCGDRIEGYQSLLKRTERVTDAVRLAIGIEMVIAKPHLDHGEFQPFIEKRLPEHGYRTAARWMEFAEMIIAKSDPGSLLNSLPTKALNGGITENDLPKLADAIEVLTKGQPHDEFIQNNKARKPIGPIKFHCVHCGAENKAVHGKKINCVQCEKKIMATPDRKQDDEALRAQIEQAQERIKSMMADLDGLMADTSDELENAGPALRKSFQATLRRLAGHIDEEFSNKKGKGK